MTSALGQTFPSVEGTNNIGMGNHVINTNTLAAQMASITTSCPCYNYEPSDDTPMWDCPTGDCQESSSGQSSCDTGGCGSPLTPWSLMVPPGFRPARLRPTFDPFMRGADLFSQGSKIANTSMDIATCAIDIKSEQPTGVSLVRVMRPLAMSIPGNFGPMMFSNYDQTLTVTRIASGGSQQIDISSFDPLNMRSMSYRRNSNASGASFSVALPLERDPLKQITLLKPDMSVISSSDSSDFHGAKYARADAWDGSYVLFQLFDIGTTGGRTGRPVKYHSLIGETTVSYKSFMTAELAASPTRALQIDTVTDRYGATLTFTYQTTQVSGSWVVSGITGPGSQTRSYTYGSGTGAKLASVSNPVGPDSTYSFTADSYAGSVAVQIADRSAPEGDQVKTLFLSNLAAVINNQSNTIPPNALRMVTNGANEVTYLMVRNGAPQQFHYEGAGRMKFVAGAATSQGVGHPEELFSSAYFRDGWSYASSMTSSMGTTPGFTGTTDTLFKQEYLYNGSESGLKIQRGDATTVNHFWDADKWIIRSEYSDGTIETYCYNGAKKVTRKRNRNGEVIKYVYDSENRLIEEHVGLKDNSTNVVGFDPYTGASTYNRCATNDVQTSEYAVRKWEYVAWGQNGAGALAATIDARNNRTDYQYNSSHQLWKILEPADSSGGARPTTVFTYNSAGRIATVTDPESRVVTYVYDAMGRKIETQYQDGTADKIEYATSGNATGLVSKTIDRLNVVTSYAYDAAQRLTTKTVASAVRGSGGSETATPYGVSSTTTYEYVHGSDLVYKTKVDGALTQYKYDHRGRVLETTSYPRTGATLTASTQYNNDQLYSRTDPYGRTTYYAYDATDGRLIRTTQGMVPQWSPPSPSGTQTLSQALLGVSRDLNANAQYIVTDLVLDASGRKTDSYNGLNTRTKMEYDTRSRLVIQKVAYGTSIEARTDTLYDAASNVTEVRSPRYFDSGDSNGSNKARETWTYNNRNRVATHTEAPGTADAATESFTYDLGGRQATRTDYGGNVWTYDDVGCCALTRLNIDPLGHGSITNANSRGQVVHTISVSDVTSSSSNYANPVDSKTFSESTTRLDARGRPIYQTAWLSARGQIDPSNPPIAGIDGVALADGLTTQYLYDSNLTDGQGLDSSAGVTVSKLGTGGAGTFSVSLSNAIAKLADTQANGGAGITFSSTTAPGRASVVINGEDEISFSITDSVGRTVMSGKLNNYRGSGSTALNTLASWSTVQHDATTNLSGYGTVLVARSIDALGNATKSWTDAAGRTLRSLDQLDNTTALTYDAAGNQLSVRDANNVGADMLYDALSRNTQRTDTFGDVTKTEYDRAGNAIKQIDAKNKNTLITFDARNRRKLTTDRISAATAFAYTALSQLASLTDAENQTTSYTYDSRGLKLTETYPDHTSGTSVGQTGYGIVTFVYDNAGRVLRKQDQLGDTVTYNYDLVGRMTSRNYRTAANSPSGTIADTDTFTFDRSGRMLSAVSGRYTNTVAYTFDPAGRKASEALTISSVTYTIGQAYNARNELTTVTYPDSSTSTRSYHSTGALNELALDGSTISTRSYDAGHRQTTEVLGNGITETRSYRSDNLLSGISYSNTSLGDLSYTWDANKNKTSESITGVMSGYGFTSGGTTYDFEDRLTGYARASGTFNQSWNLTSVGDWTSVTTNGIAQNRTHGPTHELLTAGGSSVVTDVKGNMTSIPATLRPAGATTALLLSWDFDNKLASADIDANGTADVSFQYDALGRRVARTGAGGSFVFVQMDQQTIADYPVGGAASTPTYRYVYASYIDEPVVRKGAGAGGTLVYFHRNHQYSITAVTTSVGTIAERYAYSAYGQPTILDASASVLSSSAINNRYAYTGREWDATLALHHFRARWMSPIAGRFLGRDPIGYYDIPVLYLTLFDVKGQDPSGLSGTLKDCETTKDKLKFSIFSKEEHGKLNGKIPSLDRLDDFLNRLRKLVALPELDFQVELSWKTTRCTQECECDTIAMHFKEEYRFQGKFSMKRGRIPVPQIPGTWLEIAGDLRLDFNYYHEHGGCDKIDKRETCFGGGGKLEISYCGGAPSVLQGCIKASIDCYGKGCLSLKTGVNNNSNCTLKISTEGCYGPFCRETEGRSWDIF